MAKTRTFLSRLTLRWGALFAAITGLCTLLPASMAQSPTGSWQLVKMDRVVKTSPFLQITSERYDAHGGSVDFAVDGRITANSAPGPGWCPGGSERIHYEWQFPQDITHISNGEARGIVMTVQPLKPAPPCNGDIALQSVLAIVASSGAWPYATLPTEIDTDRTGADSPYRAEASPPANHASSGIRFAPWPLKSNGPYTFFALELATRFSGSVYYVYMYRNNASGGTGGGSSAGVSIEPGVNRPGGDYNSFDTGSAATCQASCNADGRCQAFTYVNPNIQGPSGRCWLKSSVPGAQGDACCTSGIRRQGGGGGTVSYEPGTNRRGSDYSQSDLSSPDPQICRANCAADGQCRAYTYVQPNIQGPAARCWLKNAVPPAEPDQCCASGVRQ